MADTNTTAPRAHPDVPPPRRATLGGVLSILGLLVGCGISCDGGGGVAAAEPCPNVEVVFARGTLEPPGVGETGRVFADALASRLPDRTVGEYAVAYPASIDFGAAVDGVADALAHIRHVTTICPKTHVVLAGYSQGAAVAGYVTSDAIPVGYDLPPEITEPLSEPEARHVAAVVLIAKPSPDVLGLLDHDAPPITIGRYFASKTIEVCNEEDLVCSPTGHDTHAHGSYKFEGGTDDAAAAAAANVVAADR